jgi:tungstate transport system substrate-binding protein
MKKKSVKLVIASTTSTQNSGLFDILIPAYEKATQYGVSVEIIAVGTGKALRIAKKGEADMLFVHAQCLHYCRPRQGSGKDQGGQERRGSP